MNITCFFIMTLILQLVIAQEQQGGSEVVKNKISQPTPGDYKDCKDDIPAKTSGVAQHAAMEAKAAQQAQESAGAQAAHQVQLQLAERAEDAAKIAEAAYLGKKDIVNELIQLIKDTQEVVEEESSNLELEKQTMEEAEKSAKNAQSEYKLLQKGLQLAQSNVAHAMAASQGAADEFSQKDKLVNAAKIKVDQLQKQMRSAQAELASTKSAAEKARVAAKEARDCASRTVKDGCA